MICPDVPDEKDLQTPLEVGSFAWNWMEPPLGQISFFLLCAQYARYDFIVLYQSSFHSYIFEPLFRAQMENLGYKPYTQWFKHRRAMRICNVRTYAIIDFYCNKLIDTLCFMFLQEFPQYNSDILTHFSINDDLTAESLPESKIQTKPKTVSAPAPTKTSSPETKK